VDPDAGLSIVAGPSIEADAFIEACARVETGLRTDGIAIEDEFLSPPQIRSLRDCVHLRRSRGDFTAARIGGERSLQRREEIRGDSTCWIAAPLLPAEQVLLEELERLRLELNRRARLGLIELELHYAWYPPGAGYARHVDQPQGRAQRQVSLVLYLNEVWTAAAGGELRIFDAGDGYRDIAPMAGRLACFLTPGREHAVLPTRRDRLSISGWFRARD
jgi:SM-20-related protein